MTKPDIDCVVAEKQIWRCPPCTSIRRKSMKIVSDAEGGKAEIAQVVFMLEQASEDRKRMEEQFNKSFEFAHAKIDDQVKIITEQSKKIDDLLKVIDELRQENVNLKETVVKLELRLDEVEQYSRANSIEIFGVPELKNEDTYDIVKNICTALDVKITRENIDVCHRLGRPGGGSDGRPRGIIAKFVRREDKLKVLSMRKVKRNFSTSHLGYDQPAVPVYINENLSPQRRKLFAAAREVKKTKQFTYLWVQNGNILMRKDQGTPVVRITTLSDLDKLQ